VLITRASNNYGPYQFPEKLVPLFISNALEDRAVPVYGNGGNVRDWLHVEDHCRGIAAVLARGTPGQVYNLGGETERTNLEMTRAILRAVGKTDALIQYVADRPGHDFRYAVDTTRARTELGWRPRIPLDEGLAATVRWYREHEAWWRRIKSGDYRRYYEQQYGLAYDDVRRTP
jgi:dTDP-glucose 4,6-dehydratase